MRIVLDVPQNLKDRILFKLCRAESIERGANKLKGQKNANVNSAVHEDKGKYVNKLAGF